MRLGFVALVGAAALLVTTAASAQSTRLGGSNWRQRDRPRNTDREAKYGDFGFEVRFGPYYPEVDEEFGGDGPYKQVFNDNPQFYFGLEFDWTPIHIPYVGALGPGIGWGYTSTSTKAKLTDCTLQDGDEEDACDSGEDTSLTIMPMHLSAVLRIDELMHRTGIPIVPYAKLGLGLGTWSSSSGGATGKIGTGDDAIVARDTTMGLHMALGGMLALNFLERRSSATLYETSGVRHAFLFGEWMNTQLDGFGGEKMHIGTSTWVLGLAFDM